MNINKQYHYNYGNIEVIDIIEDAGHGVGFAIGNAIKYILRAPHKGAELQDLKKAAYYINRRIQQLEEEHVEIADDLR